MPLPRLLSIARGGAGFSPPPLAYTMLYNGQVGDGLVKIGRATSVNSGVTWTRDAANPVIGLGAGGTWNDEQVHGPSVGWDGSQWVMYASGYDGTNYRIGRWTSPTGATWTAYGSNPVIGLGAAAAFDEAGVIGPSFLYVSGEARPFKVWYTGKSSGAVFTLGFADSADGLSFTKRGQMLGLGTAGAFDDVSVGGGAVLKEGSTYRVFYAGSRDTGGYPNTRPGYATCTDPATAGTYTKQGQLIGLDGNITSLDDGLVYTANTLTSIVARGSGYYFGFGTALQPTPDIGQHEVAFRTTSTDLVNWTTPTGVLLPLSSGTFDTVSAENPSVIAP